MNKKYLHYTILCIALSFVCAGFAIFLKHDMVRLFAGLVLFVALIAMCVSLYKYVKVVDEAFSVQACDYQKRITDLDEKLNKSEQIRIRYREVLLNMEKEQQRPGENNPGIYFKYFKENVVNPYMTLLQNVEMPLTDAAKQTIIDSTIDLAMKAFDVADAGDWTINNREEQRLNLNIISNDQSLEQAYDAAKQITENPALTPKWIRAMSGTLKDIVSKSSKIIYSGYKF